MLPLVLAVLVSAPVSARQETFPSATPESQGLSSAALSELDAEARGYVERGLAVGAELIVIKNRKTVLHEVYGLADVEQERPWTKGVLCNIRSMTKPLTGAAIQILIDRGELGLDDPLSRYLPGFRTDEAKEISVRQVLSHRAGLPLTILSSVDEYASLVEMANAVGARGPEFEIGSKFWYSDSGTDALGALVEVVSGEKLDEFVRSELLEPLGMLESFYYYDVTDPRRERIASLYGGGVGAWQRFLDPKEETFYPYAWGSQSLYSTPRDYAKFLAMWLDGGRVGERVVLSQEAVRRMLTPACEMSMLGRDQRFPTSFKGLEVYYGQMAVLHVAEGSQGKAPAKIIGHSGSDGTIAWAWPERDLMILFFTQSRGGSAVSRLEEAVDRLLISPDLYEDAGDVPPEFAPLLGTYIADWANHMREEFVVHVKNGKLALDVPSQMDFELQPAEAQGRWNFAIAPAISVYFERDDAGTIDCLRVQQGSMTFEAPRKGTPHEAELREAQRADPEALAKLLGEYEEPEEDAGHARVFIDGDYLAVEGGAGDVFHLWKVPGQELWIVRENAAMSLSFQEEEGAIVSFTRNVPGGGELVYPRVE